MSTLARAPAALQSTSGCLRRLSSSGRPSNNFDDEQTDEAAIGSLMMEVSAAPSLQLFSQPRDGSSSPLARSIDDISSQLDRLSRTLHEASSTDPGDGAMLAQDPVQASSHALHSSRGGHPAPMVLPAACAPQMGASAAHAITAQPAAAFAASSGLQTLGVALCSSPSPQTLAATSAGSSHLAGISVSPTHSQGMQTAGAQRPGNQPSAGLAESPSTMDTLFPFAGGART
jgi:hypothetical protein